MPSFTMLQHLYNCAISGRIVGKKNQEDFNYLVRLMLQDVHRQTIYEKAMSAVILEYVGKREQALDYVESLCQYTETYDNRGRSFKTSRATYSWYSYKIPTHVAAMEAIYHVCPDKQQILVEMQKWLLNEKRTQTWETPIDSVNAVHALLLGNVDILHIAHRGGGETNTRLNAERSGFILCTRSNGGHHHHGHNEKLLHSLITLPARNSKWLTGCRYHK